MWRKEKGAPNHGRSRNPRQGAKQNSTWPTPPFGGAVQALLLFAKSLAAQFGGICGKQFLTLARRSNCRKWHQGHEFMSVIGSPLNADILPDEANRRNDTLISRV